MAKAKVFKVAEHEALCNICGDKVVTTESRCVCDKCKSGLTKKEIAK